MFHKSIDYSYENATHLLHFENLQPLTAYTFEITEFLGENIITDDLQFQIQTAENPPSVEILEIYSNSVVLKTEKNTSIEIGSAEFSNGDDREVTITDLDLNTIYTGTVYKKLSPVKKTSKSNFSFKTAAEAPVPIELEKTATTIKLSWNGLKETNVRYELSIMPGDMMVVTESLVFDVTGLQPETEYSIKLRASYGITKTDSNLLMIRTLALGPKIQPMKITSDSISVTWDY